ncbi:valine--tRNA ligase [Candidatus Woesearchaeota archaeon]|nr:valine--tRNA ligase [Candidatus Woesearchaeota archaeon]
MELEKIYDAEKVENKYRQFWKKEKIYDFDFKSKKPVFSIDVPPPYASAGHLHVGHALHYTQFEIIARYKRMQGFNVYFAPCFDNNGLPTEKYVEEKNKISKGDIPRDKFRKLCREESAKVEKEYGERVFDTLGHSYNWGLLYTTIDKEAQRVSQMSFIDLYKKGYAYRAEEPTLWCPYHQTALAQAEVEDISRTTTLYYLNFDTEQGKKIDIATTRPEFLAACVAVFVHPDDKRYKNLVGKNAIVPLFGQKVPIKTDKKVDKDFGTGIVMVCTFGDNTDIEWWKEHNLPLKVIIDKEGKLNEETGKYKGLSLLQGRERTVEDLRREARVIKEESLQQQVGVCWRCGTPIEFIVTKQWFIKTLDFKKDLIKQGRKINWYPDFYRKRYEDWTKNLNWDWCISRQRYYGVPIPAWYCEDCGNIILPKENDLPVDPLNTKIPAEKCPKCNSKKIKAEEDVFDTWMTSSMSPEIAARWLEKPDSFKELFPMSLRPQSHDIIRTWAFYTILKAYLHFKDIPWENIAIGTFVLDSKGRGMSKSKGNVVWTDELLKKYNVDVVRYWVATASWGEDLRFNEQDLEKGRRFLTKLWNASRFTLMHLKGFNPGKIKKPELKTIDKGILTKYNKLLKESKQHFDVYKSQEAKKSIEYFFWHVFCDNYLEMVKKRVYEPKDKKEKESALYVLYKVLLGILKMIAPFVPFITEEIYQSYFKDIEGKKSIHLNLWDEYDKKEIDDKAEKLGDKAVDIISYVRKYKSENNMSLKQPIPKLIIESKDDLSGIYGLIKSTINIEEIEKGKADKKITDDIKLKVID